MFLEDRLLLTARSWDKTYDGAVNTIGEMMTISFDSLKVGIGKNETDETIIANFNRVNKTWERTALILEKEGIGFARVDGFKAYVKSMSEPKWIIFK